MKHIAFNQNESIKTPSKNKIINNILIHVSQDYQKQYGKLKTASTFRKHPNSHIQIIELSSNQPSSYINHQSIQKEDKINNQSNNSKAIEKNHQEESQNQCQEENQNERKDLRDEMFDQDNSEMYPFIDIDINQVHSYSVGTYVDLGWLPEMKSVCNFQETQNDWMEDESQIEYKSSIL